MSEPEREAAPSNALPDWSECSLRVDNSAYLAKSVSEGGYGDSDSPQANQLHRFIYEYDDADPYRSAWFMHRLELLLEETKADLERQLAEAKAEIEAMRPVVEAARFHAHLEQSWFRETSPDTYHCEICQSYAAYESRKQP